LVKGLCSFFLVLLDSSAFLIYNILTFHQKKKKSMIFGFVEETICVYSLLAAASFCSPSFLLAAASFSLSFYMLRNPSLYFTK